MTSSANNMILDESFKKPGAIPFKWEVRPGVPKTQQHHNPHPRYNNPHEPPLLSYPEPHPLPLSPPQKLKPPPLTPPSASPFLPPHELRNRSLRSAPRTRSERWRLNLNLNQPSLARAECVSPGCFPTPLLLKKNEGKKMTIRMPKSKPKPKPEADYYGSDSETRSRSPWSVLSRRSVSPFREGESPSRSSCYSFDIDYSSPRLSVSSRISSRSTPRRRMGDAEWAGFGLF